MDDSSAAHLRIRIRRATSCLGACSLGASTVGLLRSIVGQLHGHGTARRADAITSGAGQQRRQADGDQHNHRDGTGGRDSAHELPWGRGRAFTPGAEALTQRFDDAVTTNRVFQHLPANGSQDDGTDNDQQTASPSDCGILSGTRQPLAWQKRDNRQVPEVDA